MLKLLFIFGLFNIYLQLYTSIRTRRQFSWYSNFRCMVNESYKENYCNDCMCVKGKLGCTRQICPGQKYFLARYCNVGQKWKESCNHCACTSEYGTVCTVRNCWVPKGSDEDGKPPDIPDTSGESNPDCTYPPDDYDYYGDGDKEDGPPPDTSDEDGPRPDPDDSGDQDNPECTYPPDNYDYYGDKGW